MYENTGVTYQTEPNPVPEPLKATLVRREASVAAYLLMPLASVVLLVFAQEGGLDQTASTALGAVALFMLVGWPILMWRGWRKNRAGARLGNLLLEKLRERNRLAQVDVDQILVALRHPKLTPADRVYQSHTAYLDLVTAVVRDLQVMDSELELLTQLEDLLPLDNSFWQDARVDAFRQVYLEAVADHELTEEEENALDHVRDRLAIPAPAVAPELEVVARLREIRRIRQGELPVIEPSFPLQKSEVCHFEANARLLKEKNLRTFQSQGQRYKVRGLVIDKEGSLLVTDKRLLLVHDGATSVRLDKILDVEIDSDRNLLLIKKDGAEAPVLITTPDCTKAGAILAAACRQ